jgi:predicted hotdog family 3-hydroxylacyl-ACP dehydratase
VPEAPAETFPPVEDLVPHARPMRLLARVLQHDASSTTCEVELGHQSLFRGEDGRIPCWVGLEYMAQCVAAHAGLEARSQGVAPRVGFVMGSRRLRFHRPFHPADGVLEVVARHLRGRVELGALSFACEIHSPGGSRESGDTAHGELLAEGTINIAIPRDLTAATEESAS